MPRRTLFARMLPSTLLVSFAASLQAPASAIPLPPDAPPANSPACGGSIVGRDAKGRMVTIEYYKVDRVVSVPKSTKIFKIGDAPDKPTGTFADLKYGAVFAARANDDFAKTVATDIYLQTAWPPVLHTQPLPRPRHRRRVR